MSKVKLRNVVEICADCGTPDPSWASVNRGIMVCDECCSIHRSLGRHISQIKSLKKGAWTSAQLAMVHTLYGSGANSVWEHTLLDPTQSKSGRKKPTHKDPIHPTKADFIRAKYQNLAFVHRPNKEDAAQTEDDISQQLYSSVRTPNVETSLRLLSFGADPNYMHPEKGNTPLHVASTFGQASQSELLVVYGADPAAPDTEGRTPIDIAKKSGHDDLASRLLDCQYEVTDRLAYYLCGRKPDHSLGQHFIIPEMADSLDLSELAKAAKKKLQALPNHLFEELAMDVYDEVDRRENDAIWLATQNHSALVTDRQTIPFLPVNPEFSTTRNQGRQKLARFNAREFATLIIDILNEAKRRQTGLPLNRFPARADTTVNGRTGTDGKGNLSDDEPVYDSVASDDENAEAPGRYAGLSSRNQSRPASEQGAGRPITLQEYLEVKKQLASSELRIGHLLKSNKDMRHEINILQSMVQKLVQENSQLRAFMGCCLENSGNAGAPPSHHSSSSSPSHHHHHNHSHHPRSMPECHRVLPNGYESGTPPPAGQQHSLHLCSYSDSLIVGSSGSSAGGVINSHSGRGSSPRAVSQQQRPASMYEPRQFSSQGWPPGSSFVQNNPCCSHASGYSLPRDDSGIGHTHSSHSSRNSGDYDNTSGQVSHSSSCPHSRSNSLSPPTELAPLILQQPGGRPPLTVGGEGLPLGRGTGDGLPTRDEVMRKTEQITKKIQELLLSAQEGKHECFTTCSEKIYRAVLEMASIFPQTPYEEAIHAALKQLTSCALRLQLECRSLLSQQQQLQAPLQLQPQGPIDHRFITQQVIQCAYDIAKAAKQIVTYSE